jgi:hypothetical protein
LFWHKRRNGFLAGRRGFQHGTIVPVLIRCQGELAWALRLAVLFRLASTLRTLHHFEFWLFTSFFVFGFHFFFVCWWHHRQC